MNYANTKPSVGIWNLGGFLSEMKKNILILTTTNEFLRKFEWDHVKLLLQMGYRVHYASNMKEPPYISDQQWIEKNGVQVHHIEIMRSPYLWKENQKALRDVLFLIKKYNIQILHCHTPVGGLIGRLAGFFCQKQKLTVLYTAHGFHFYQGAPWFHWLIYYQAEKFLAHYTDILIVINQEDYKRAKKFHLRKGGSLYRIPGVGLNRSYFSPLDDLQKIEIRKSLGIETNIFLMVSLGELNENKNHKLILEALFSMAREGKDLTGLCYIICGDGFYRNRMEEWIQEFHLEKHVFLYGHRRNIKEILGCADISIFPSKREGLGMAALESLAMGIPVLAADNRGTREYMVHKKNGYICDADDIEGIKQGIEFFQNLSAEKRKQMSDFCRKSTQPFDNRYTLQKMSRVYEEADKKQRHKMSKGKE